MMKCQNVTGGLVAARLFVLLIIYFGCAGSSLLLELFHLHRAGVLLVAVCGLLTVGASRCGRRPQAQGLQWLRQAGSAVAAGAQQYLWCTGLVAPPHVGSPWTRV